MNVEEIKNAYTPEELTLNRKLYEECQKADIDFAVVEELLKQGADPLGTWENTDVWQCQNHIYGELVGDSQDTDSINLPGITELFLKYGMDVMSPRVPYDGENSLHPLWEYAFIPNKNAIRALKMLLDAGLDADSFAEFWGHSTFDLINLGFDDYNDLSGDFAIDWCTWTMKMIMLGASYDHILSEDEDLQKFIGCGYNNFDLHRFRDWDAFEYTFDTSHCSNGFPEFYHSVVHISEKETGQEVWKIGVCLKEGEF